MVKANKLIDLMKSEEKPKPEPKASKALAFLSVFLIGLGYGCVFYLRTRKKLHYALLTWRGSLCSDRDIFSIFTVERVCNTCLKEKRHFIF